MFLINILLVDDHKLFAKSLCVALDGYPEAEQLYLAQNLGELEEILCEKRIDVVLLDMNLGELGDEDGLHVAAGLLKKDSSLKIIILTGYDLPVYRHEAKKIGVRGFLSKSINPDDLVAALLKVYEGGACFPPEKDGAVIEDMTNMEKRILREISAGKKRRAIADELYMSERTLSNHLQHIFEKMGVSSTVEAVTKAIQMGYIPPIC